MKRKDRSAVGKQKDSCDVWLDPSALKRRKTRDVATKPTFTPLGQNSYPAAIIGPPHPRSKQTTISTFFTAQKAGDKTTDPSKGLTTSASNDDAVNLKDSEVLRGERTRASVLQPLSLQDCQRQPAKATDVPGPFLCSSLRTRAQSHTDTPLVAREEDAVTERGAFLTTDLPCPLGEKGSPRQQWAARSPLREKNHGWPKEESLTFFSRRRPGFKMIPNQRTGVGKQRRPPSSWAALVDDTENTDPERKGNLPAAARLDCNLTGSCRKYTDATSCEDSALASTQRLFTQDSEGYRVILHRLGGEGGEPSLPKEPVGSSFEKESCFREGWAGGRSPPGSLGRRAAVVPPLAERSEKSCHDLLFTEDSEGNRVIKH